MEHMYIVLCVLQYGNLRVVTIKVTNLLITDHNCTIQHGVGATIITSQSHSYYRHGMLCDVDSDTINNYTQLLKACASDQSDFGPFHAYYLYNIKENF